MSSFGQRIKLFLPDPHEAQAMFVHWNAWHPNAQVLVAPCGTKFGKSFGMALWLAKEAWNNPGSYCVWLAPTYLKCRIGYRYLKCMLDIPDFAECVDGKLEIRLANGSFIKFLHGRDAEITVEGEGIDRFCIDEAGKQSKQLWYSLFTTITQTHGKGIIAGTPRGYSWFYDEFRKAKAGDPFYAWATFKTMDSPYVKAKAVEQARRLLPLALFQQYYEAMFVSMSSVFGDLSQMFMDGFEIKPKTKFWIHPDASARALDTVTGWDIAKKRDYTVFYTVNSLGQLVGFARFKQVPYEMQVDRLKYYLHTYFKGDRDLRYDATGVGEPVGEMLADKDIDAGITAVTFTNKSKQEMINRTIMAIENGWHKAPRIEQIEHEFGSYEVSVTKSGLFTYSAPSGDHDDCVSAGMLAISGAYQEARAEEVEKEIEKIINSEEDLDREDDDDNEDDGEDFSDIADAFSEDADDFFEGSDESTEQETDDFSFPA